MNNELPQGSVLVPILFNLYIHSVPNTEEFKFQSTDDIAHQSRDLKDGNVILTKDLKLMNTYFRKWRLKLNPL